MSGVWLPIASLCISVFLVIIFFIKPHINTRETKVYAYMLIFNCIFSFLGVFGYIYAVKYGNLLFFSYYQKVYLIILILLAALILQYNIVICNFSEKKYNVLLKINVFIALIFSILIMVFDITPIINDDIVDISGTSYNIAMCFILVYFIAMLIFTIYYIFSNRGDRKKIIPILLLIVLEILGLLLQRYFREVITETFFFAFFYLTMYFTIENPDVKMLELEKQARDDAERANRAKTDFLSSMSHEIRTPLNAIIGFSECVIESKDVEEIKENITDILNASDMLLETVNGILDISKIESGMLEINEVVYDSNRLLNEVIRLAKARINEKPIEFKVHIASDIPPYLYGDSVNVKKILLNLLSNAAKYTDEGFIEFSVKCVKVNDMVRLFISVKDTGRGIRKEDINKLFTKFQRVDEEKNSTIEGTGLGLAITKQLLEMMKGTIVVSSEYGEGSEFKVAIDQKISNTDVIDEVLEYQELDLSGKKVLIVDDNNTNLKVATKLLQKYNIDVDNSNSGFDCIDKIMTGKTYDLILMDDRMPKMTGSTTMLKLKEIKDFNTPIVVLTANAIEGMKEEYISRGFDAFLAKPIGRNELFTILNKYLNTSTSYKEEKEIIINDYSDKKLLIIDDNILNTKVAIKLLEPYNFNIDTAISGKDGLNLIENNSYDIILLDLIMSDLNGFETFEEIKKIDNNVKIIALSVENNEEFKNKSRSLGFDDYLTKPIDKKSLDIAINKCLNNR